MSAPNAWERCRGEIYAVVGIGRFSRCAPRLRDRVIALGDKTKAGFKPEFSLIDWMRKVSSTTGDSAASRVAARMNSEVFFP